MDPDRIYGAALAKAKLRQLNESSAGIVRATIDLLLKVTTVTAREQTLDYARCELVAEKQATLDAAGALAEWRPLTEEELENLLSALLNSTGPLPK